MHTAPLTRASASKHTGQALLAGCQAALAGFFVTKRCGTAHTLVTDPGGVGRDPGFAGCGGLRQLALTLLQPAFAGLQTTNTCAHKGGV